MRLRPAYPLLDAGKADVAQPVLHRPAHRAPSTGGPCATSTCRATPPRACRWAASDLLQGCPQHRLHILQHALSARGGAGDAGGQTLRDEQQRHLAQGGDNRVHLLQLVHAVAIILDHLLQPYTWPSIRRSRSSNGSRSAGAGPANRPVNRPPRLLDTPWGMFRRLPQRCRLGLPRARGGTSDVLP